MKKLFLIFSTALMAATAHSQDVVNWACSSKKIADGKYEIHFKATLQEPWHTYSQSTPEGGPLPTKFTFTKNPLLKMEGAVKEDGEMKMTHDKTFDVDVRYFAGDVDFVQVVSIKGSAKTKFTGKVEFMACNDHECLPPKTIPFSIALP